MLFPSAYATTLRATRIARISLIHDSQRLGAQNPRLSCRRSYVSGIITPKKELNSGNTYTQPAENLSQTVTAAEKREYDRTVQTNKEKQAKAPWMRDGSDRPPVEKIGSSKSFAKGKLLTTPSRMLKLIIPLAGRDALEDDRKDKELEPLALLVHPQQPLSYLERLLQSELPSIKDDGGKERIPGVWFRAPDTAEASDSKSTADDNAGEKSKEKQQDGEAAEKEAKELDSEDITVIDGERVRTGRLKNNKKQGIEDQKDIKATVEAPGPEKATEPGPMNEQPSQADDETAGFVRWSHSTEIGDFIRDAAKAGNFALDIEGAQESILVAVPSFHDRTYYLRMRLRQKSIEIGRLADIKLECDNLAEKGAKRVAIAGGGALIAYWWVVYLLTFRTELGWDVMEPVTYLVGLSTLIGGYVWFLVHNRQVSYRSAMKFTISRRQSKLYEQKGFDIQQWEDLVQEGNRLRREIKLIAEEYDVGPDEWNEKDDAKSEKVIKALEEERKKQKEEKKKENEDDD